MPNVSNFGTSTDNAVVQGTVTDRQMVIPDVPPQGLLSVGPRVSFNFIKEPWSEQTSYQFYDVVKDSKGTSYVAIKPVVPAGTELNDGNYWFKWSEPNTQINDLYEIVETYNQRINDNTEDIAALNANKAPNNHASAETIYGVANAASYGHVKLADAGNSDANGGIAATPKMIDTQVTNLQTNVNQLITNLQNKVNTQKNMVVIGDSFSAEDWTTNTGVWHKHVANVLGLKDNNFAIGGAGFLSNTTFSTQLDTASTQVDKDTVAVLFIYGGVNDQNTTEAEYKNAVSNTLTKARQLFPKSPIVLMGPNTFKAAQIGDPNSNVGTFYKANAMFQAAISNAIYVDMQRASIGMAADGRDNHPGVSDQKNIAIYLLSKLFGNSYRYGYTEVWNADVTNNNADFSIHFKIIDGNEILQILSNSNMSGDYQFTIPNNFISYYLEMLPTIAYTFVNNSLTPFNFKVNSGNYKQAQTISFTLPQNSNGLYFKSIV